MWCVSCTTSCHVGQTVISTNKIAHKHTVRNIQTSQWILPQSPLKGQFGISKRFPNKENLEESCSGFSATANNSFNNAPAPISPSDWAIPALFTSILPTCKYQNRTGALSGERSQVRSRRALNPK
jgi:hypothetical protein